MVNTVAMTRIEKVRMNVMNEVAIRFELMSREYARATVCGTKSLGGKNKGRSNNNNATNACVLHEWPITDERWAVPRVSGGWAHSFPNPLGLRTVNP